MSRIAGLNDLKGKEDSGKDKKKNEYFAGGVDNRGGGSGLAVEGPPPPTGRRPLPGASSDPFDSIVRQATEGSAEGSSGSGQQPITITLYRNGFTVNDGPLRDTTSPESRRFLAALEQGQVPAELTQGLSLDPGAPALDVHLADKRQEDFVPPPPPAYVAYSGVGSRIGKTSSGDEACVFTEDMLEGAEEIVADESRPSTTVQVKTSDGKKLRVKMNHEHSVLQLAAHIHRVSGRAAAAFTLSAGFPPKDIVDPTLSLAEAGLLGASITQKSLS